jgi:Na+/H+ antiporter NhaD/arsenite permease-like protein
VSAQFRLAGFYTHVSRRLVAADVSPPRLLALVVGLAGLLSAVLTNDIVCLAMAPVLVEGCARRGLDPLPFLLALACASNVGSAATLIGKPAEHPDRPGPAPVVHRLPEGCGRARAAGPRRDLGGDRVPVPRPLAARAARPADHRPALQPLAEREGLTVTAVLVVAFLFFPRLPREWVALVCAGVLLLSRRMASREMMSLVDWQLLVLFVGLFVVNDAFQRTGAMAEAVGFRARARRGRRAPGALFGLSVVLSNLVSNVPATMLLLPSATHPQAGPILALASTLAGNLMIVGSIANIIVVTAREGWGWRLGGGRT